MMLAAKLTGIVLSLGITGIAPTGVATLGLTVSVATVANASAKGTARASGKVATPSERFAHTITKQARSGWRIRHLDINEVEGGDGVDYRTVLSVTIASGKSAKRHDLEFTRDGDRAIRYRQRSVRVPREARVYPVEAEFLRLLAISPPSMMVEECGSYYLDGFDAGLAIDTMNYYVLEERHIGRRAATELRKMLVDSLEIGLDLVEVRKPETRPSGAAQAVMFSFAGEINRVIHAGLDRSGRVRSVEARQVPYLGRWQVYSHGDELLVALKSGSPIGRIAIADTGADSEDLTVTLNGATKIDADDFEPGDTGEHVCPC